MLTRVNERSRSGGEHERPVSGAWLKPEHSPHSRKGFYAQIHEIFRLLKVPMAYAQSIPAKIASKSIGLRLSLKA